MSNIILASTVFFYSFMAPAEDVLCEGIVHYSENGYRLSMLRGTIVTKNEDTRMFWVGDRTVTVDVEKSLTTKFERLNNDHVQIFWTSSCLGVK